VTSDTFKKAIIGEQTIRQSVDNGEIELQGNIEHFIEVFEMFDPYIG